MNSSNPYGYRAAGGRHGDVTTSPGLVRHMLDLVGYKADIDLSGVSLLEPSCGDGGFLVEVAQRLMTSARTYGFDANHAFSHMVTAYEIDAGKVDVCKHRLRLMGLEGPLDNIHVADFLRTDTRQVDVVVGNPPYVRYENMPPECREHCRKNFSTFHYRADLYIPFFEKTLLSLNPGGRHCLVCANRWLKNEYGKRLRSMVAGQYRLRVIINLERATDAFNEEVLAYPAVTLTTNDAPVREVLYADCCDVAELSRASFVAKPMPSGCDWSGIFSSYGTVEGFCGIEEQGFKIGVGVATGADSIFISSRLPEMVENELLLPAINARNLRGDRMQWHGEYLLNPYAPDGALIDLEAYPRARHYLEEHRGRLANRHVARKDSDRWYRTIDKIYPEVCHATKILLPDISGNRIVFIDEGNYYPLHNIYYITGHYVREQKVLCAILMSDTVRDQVRSITNNMNGGYPRWQSQYLRKLLIPNIHSIAPAVVDEIVDRYDAMDTCELSYTVKHLFEKRPTVRPIQKTTRSSQTGRMYA